MTLSIPKEKPDFRKKAHELPHKPGVYLMRDRFNRVIYVGKAWAGDPTTTVYYVLPGWTRVDGSVYYRWKRYDLSLNCQNALDRKYITSAQSALTLNTGEERKFTLSMSTRV